MNDFWPAIYAVTPTILLGLVFWFVMRSLIRADKSERKALAKVETEERARLGLSMEKAAAE
jgi:flagellar biosynthesis/type III secretory pathway M-ring protein FliF/YscJ